MMPRNLFDLENSVGHEKDVQDIVSVSAMSNFLSQNRGAELRTQESISVNIASHFNLNFSVDRSSLSVSIWFFFLCSPGKPSAIGIQ